MHFSATGTFHLIRFSNVKLTYISLYSYAQTGLFRNPVFFALSLENTTGEQKFKPVEPVFQWL